MTWLDYYCETGGLYLASHDPLFEKTELVVNARNDNASLEFAILKTFNRRMMRGTADFALGLHEGDWHRGAEIYRRFFDSTGERMKKPASFMRKAPGIMCHYDFKWQNGTVNHHFKDIPRLHLESRENGFNALLVAGWNVNGFDNSYPDFRPDPELGTERELKKAVEIVHENDGEIFFYVNAYSFDTSSPDYPKFGAKCAVKTMDGDVIGGQWGDRFLAGMCNSCAEWRAKVKDNIRYVLETLGADGVYIDQLAGTPQTCFDNEHEHEASWRLNYQTLIAEAVSELGKPLAGRVFLFSEWLSDILATRLDAQLIHTCWGSGRKYAFPEMFKYAFPETMLFDQILQKPWGGIPAEVEGRHAKNVICQMFVNDIKYWCYDHVPDAPETGVFLKKTIELLKTIQENSPVEKFVDDLPIAEIDGEAVVKAYETPRGDYRFRVWNQTGEPGAFRLKTPINARKILIRGFNGTKIVECDSPIKHISYTSSTLQEIEYYENT
jgi:hypothetical protein